MNILNYRRGCKKSVIFDMAKLKSEKSWVTKVLIHPITLTIISLTAALGGVPGIKMLFENKKPNFSFRCDKLARGVRKFRTEENKVDSLAFMILSGAIINSGEVPLSPITIEAVINFRGKEIKTESVAIPDGFSGYLKAGDSTQIVYPKGKDLLGYTSIKKDDPVYGSLFYYVNGITKPQLEYMIENGAKIILYCKDINDKVYTYKFDPPNVEGAISDPKEGILIKRPSVSN